MRYVLITSDGPEHRYVANRLDREIGLSAIVVDVGRPRNPGHRLLQLWQRYTIPQLCGRVVLRGLKFLWRDDQISQIEMRNILGPDSDNLTHPELEIRVQGINSPEGIEHVRSIKMDRLLVYGTGLINANILSLSEQAPLNMHTGISPYYRGASCAFWPLHDDDLGNLGATIHEVTSDVDGGNIFSTRRAALQPTDGLHTVFARCVVVGTDQYVETLKRLEHNEKIAEPQNLDAGREFRTAMRGLFAELRVRRLIRLGLISRWCARG